MLPISLYVHWPFCLHKCPYCDFNSHVRDEVDETQWHTAFLAELEYYKDILSGKRINSIFFGGGTPTLMPPTLVSALIDKLSSFADVPADVEITLEGNPTSVEAGKLADFKHAGINRVSLGIQALNDKDLKFLGREHSANEGLAALEKAATLFERYSFDLIYARPEQTLSDWKNELAQALPLMKSHASLYQLTIEKGTPFYSQFHKGAFTLPDEALASDMYELTNEMLAKQKLYAYEISNYAIKGHECQHNLNYWHYGDYVGIGPGAHGRVHKDKKRYATMTIHHPEQWLKSVFKKGHGLQHNNLLNASDQLEELLMFGLRLKTGINLARAKAVLQNDLLSFLNKKMLDALKNEGLLLIDKTHLKLTEKGRLLTNSVVTSLV